MDRIKLVSATASTYCICGAGMQVSAPWEVVEHSLKSFWLIRQGEGHKPCMAKEARKARKKSEISILP